MNTFLFSQNYEDIVILKDGSEIYGIIIEQKPNDYLKIKSGKNTFVYKYSDIELIKKELITSSNSFASKKIQSDIFSKKHSIGLGLGTSKTSNLFLYTYDFELHKNFSLYGLIGLDNLFGIGLAWEQNYNENGLMLGLSTGMNFLLYPFRNLSLSYQWRIRKTQNFVSLGISSYSWQYAVIDTSSLDDRTYWDSGFVPVISIDRRFGF